MHSGVHALLQCVSADGVDGGQVQMWGLVLCRLNPWREGLKAQLSTVELQPTCVLSSLGGNAMLCAPFATKTCQQVWYVASLMTGRGEDLLPFRFVQDAFYLIKPNYCGLFYLQNLKMVSSLMSAWRVLLECWPYWRFHLRLQRVLYRDIFHCNCRISIVSRVASQT